MHKRCTVGAALFFFLLCFALSFPAIASAQLFSGSIVPCGQVGTGTLCAANELRICTLCDLVALIQRVLSFLIFLATLISVLLFVYAGVLMIMSGGNSGELSRAKNIFWNVLVGFIIVLAAFLIINVIMTTLYRGDDKDADVKGPWRPWQTIVCDQVLDRAQVCKPLVKPSVDAMRPPVQPAPQPEMCFIRCSLQIPMQFCYNGRTLADATATCEAERQRALQSGSHVGPCGPSIPQRDWRCNPGGFPPALSCQQNPTPSHFCFPWRVYGRRNPLDDIQHLDCASGFACFPTRQECERSALSINSGGLDTSTLDYRLLPPESDWCQQAAAGVSLPPGITQRGDNFQDTRAGFRSGTCVGCVPLTGITIKNPGACYGQDTMGFCLITPSTLTALTAMNSALGNTLRITEAWPPTVQHVSNCHYNGTCVDATIIGLSFTDSNTATDVAVIRRLADIVVAARSAGIRAQLEVPPTGSGPSSITAATVAVMNQMINDRLQALQQAALSPRESVILVTHATGIHYSLYTE